MQAIVIILVIVLIIAVGLFQLLAAQRRRRELYQWCRLKNLAFDPGQNFGVADQFPDFECLHKGENQYAYNVMTGDWHGHPLMGFDYHYETHSNDEKGWRTTHYHFSAMVLSSRVPLKPLLVRPEGIFDKVSTFFGFEDINFESVEFSRAFFVKAADKRWAYEVIHARMMEFLLASPRFTIQFSQYQVMAFNNRRFSVSDFIGAANLIKGMLDRLPDYVQKQQLEKAEA